MTGGSAGSVIGGSAGAVMGEGADSAIAGTPGSCVWKFSSCGRFEVVSSAFCSGKSQMISTHVSSNKQPKSQMISDRITNG